MATQKELLKAHQEGLVREWRERWPNGQWTFIHGDGSYWVAHQVRRSTSHVRCRAKNAAFYKNGTFTGTDAVFYPSRWYGKPCRVEHLASKAALLARLERAGVPAAVISEVRSWPES